MSVLYLSKVAKTGNSVRLYFEEENEFNKKMEKYKSKESVRIQELSDDHADASGHYYPTYVDALFNIEATVAVPSDYDYGNASPVNRMIAKGELPLLVFLSNNMNDMQSAHIMTTPEKYLWLASNPKSIKVFIGEKSSDILHKLSECTGVYCNKTETNVEQRFRGMIEGE